MNQIFKLFVLLLSVTAMAQTGHVMQGIGAVNMSMGGAATAQPLDITGAILWNPAGLSTFKNNSASLNVGLFFSSPELSSTLPANMMFDGSPEVSGITKDDRGISVMPALAMVWAKPDSKHTYALSAFGVSGFGVTFKQETNLPMDAQGNPNPSWDPSNSNPISYPQNMGGFGHIESDCMVMQVSMSYAYQITDKLSVGIQPTINISSLELAPSPLSSPSMTLGYPESDKAFSMGYGGQIGVFYDTKKGLKLGASYKSTQYFSELEFSNTYLDGSIAPDVNFSMDYPAIYSFVLVYSTDLFYTALDFRYCEYGNTDGFERKGWTQTGSVQGFGWKNVNVLSLGIQYKGIKKMPIRIGYTYSSNPIREELAFYSIPATAVIKDAFQVGFGYEFANNFTVNAVYHHGASDGKTEGNLLNPMAVSPSNPYGAIPGTKVGYEMTTDLIQLGINYTFKK